MQNHSPLEGAVEKPLVGRMAFTPLTRGAFSTAPLWSEMTLKGGVILLSPQLVCPSKGSDNKPRGHGLPY